MRINDKTKAKRAKWLSVEGVGCGDKLSKRSSSNTKQLFRNGLSLSNTCTNSYCRNGSRRTHMNLFFATLFVNVENPQISPQKIILNRRLVLGRPCGCRWFSDEEKLQAQLPKFSKTITLKPKRKEKGKA